MAKSTHNQRKNPVGDDPFSLLARFEIGSTKNQLALWLITTVAIIVIAVMGMIIVKQNQQIAYLAENRTMFGFANEDGVYVSSDDRPARLVKRYARDFVHNLYNFDRTGVKANFSQAKEMLDTKVAANYESYFQDQIEKVKNQRLSQALIIRQSKLDEKPDGYVVKFRASIVKYVSRTETERYNSEITVRLAKVSPTESRPEGLAVMRITEDKIQS